LVEWSRYVVIVPALASIVGAFALMAVGTWEMIEAIVDLADLGAPLKESVLGVLTAVDALLLATVLLVIGYGLYELFVDSRVALPPWLQIDSLDDLKAKIIGVVVAIIAVLFLGELVNPGPATDVLWVGLGSGAVVIGLAAFTLASRK